MENNQISRPGGYEGRKEVKYEQVLEHDARRKI